MGFFSWKTADTGESIPNVHSSRHAGRPVYFLQPDGRPAIREPAYDGYGVFGGHDVHLWLAHQNLPAQALRGFSRDDQRSMGIALDTGGNLHRDVVTGELCTIFYDMPFLAHVGVQATHVPQRWDLPVKAFGGLSPNDAVATRRLEPVPLDQVMMLRCPLKFSFNPKADYSQWGGSPSCPHQGYFYDDV